MKCKKCGGVAVINADHAHSDIVLAKALERGLRETTFGQAGHHYKLGEVKVQGDATVAQAEQLREAGAAIVRVAVDSREEAEALGEIRRRTPANLSVDLQESYRLAEVVAPHVDKIRYNPGHLWHHEKEKPVREKVAWLAAVARDNDCAVRVGVNCGSVDPEMKARFPGDDLAAMVESARESSCWGSSGSGWSSAKRE